MAGCVKEHFGSVLSLLSIKSRGMVLQILAFGRCGQSRFLQQLNMQEKNFPQSPYLKEQLPPKAGNWRRLWVCFWESSAVGSRCGKGNKCSVNSGDGLAHVICSQLPAIQAAAEKANLFRPCYIKESGRASIRACLLCHRIMPHNWTLLSAYSPIRNPASFCCPSPGILFPNADIAAEASGLERSTSSSSTPCPSQLQKWTQEVNPPG